MSDTTITPAALLQLRDELDALRGEQAASAMRIRHCEAQLRDLEGVAETINELDDRADSSERRHDASETALRDMGAAVRRLVSGVTTRDLVSERVEKHMLAVLQHLRVPEAST